MLQLAPPPGSLQGPPPLQQLADAELALLACAIGDHLPVELGDRVLAVRARRAALARRLGVEQLL